jgi:hypothetical protein
MADAGRTVEQFRVRGAAAARAHEAVRSAFGAGLRDRDPVAYNQLLRTFHAAVAAALPSAQPRFMSALAAGDPRSAEVAIAFLEADPFFFRSGYEKQALIRHLKRIPLTDAQRERLGRVVIAAIDGRDRAELRHYGRLAAGVWTPALEQAVEARMDIPDAGVARRAFWIAKSVVDAGKA